MSKGQVVSVADVTSPNGLEVRTRDVPSQVMYPAVRSLAQGLWVEDSFRVRSPGDAEHQAP